jgi:hypothetical protein
LIIKIVDFSLWAENGKWNTWKNLSPLDHLTPFVPKIYNFLSGYAPIEAQMKYMRYWGNSAYSLKKGYQQLVEDFLYLPNIRFGHSSGRALLFQKLMLFTGYYLKESFLLPRIFRSKE